METLITKLKGVANNLELLAENEVFYRFHEDDTDRSIRLNSSITNCVISVDGDNYINKEGTQSITLSKNNYTNLKFNSDCDKFKITNYYGIIGLSVTGGKTSGATLDFSAISRFINIEVIDSYKSFYVGDFEELLNLRKLRTLKLRFEKGYGIKNANIGLLKNISALYSFDAENLDDTCYIYTNDFEARYTNFAGVKNIIGDIKYINGATFNRFDASPVKDTQPLFGDITNFSMPNSTAIRLSNCVDISGNIDNIKTNIPNLTHFEISNPSEITGEITNFPNSIIHILMQNCKFTCKGSIQFSKIPVIKGVNFKNDLDNFLIGISTLDAQTPDWYVTAIGITIEGNLTEASNEAIQTIKNKGYKVVINGIEK